jgi:hypothetical protein
MKPMIEPRCAASHCDAARPRRAIKSCCGELPFGPVRCAGMNTILAVAIGGTAGSVARYLTQVWTRKRLRHMRRIPA